MHALLWWPVLICARCLCFHQNPTAIDSSSELWSLVWLVPQAMQRDRGKHGGGVDSCWRLQSAGMPDGVLIDFLVLSQIFITASPSRCQRSSLKELSFGLGTTQKKKKNPQMSTCYPCARGLIYERKSSRVQFLTAEADNGGD